MQRACIVFIGLPIAVALVWLGYPGWGLIAGVLSTALFWLAALPVEPPGVYDMAPPPMESEAPASED